MRYVLWSFCVYVPIFLIFLETIKNLMMDEFLFKEPFENHHPRMTE